jgi:homopolymeric O-antigen transport system ATP-binding protein
MEVRLGFAVAAHVPAKLLLVDEVLAVGDLDFRARCLDRMAERRREGVSVLFVSHQLSVVESFCDRVIAMEKGKVVLEGDPREVIDGYRGRILGQPGGPLASKVRQVRRGTGEVTITNVEVLGPGPDGSPVYDQPFSIRLCLAAAPGTAPPTLGVALHGVDGTVLVESQSIGGDHDPLAGDGQVEIVFDRMTLLPGAYAMTVYARDREGLSEWDVHEKAYPLAVHGDRPPGERGLTTLPARWLR